MIDKKYVDFIIDILDCVENINLITLNISFEEFENSKTIYPATERYFEIMGEAANRIPDYLQEQYHDVPWREVIGMRNIIIHAYDHVIPDILWKTIKLNLPPLKESLSRMLIDLENK